LKGRPFGGEAILRDTSVIKNVGVVGSDPSGCCAAIKVVFSVLWKEVTVTQVFKKGT